MNRSRGMLVPLLPLALVFGSVATVSAVILIVVVSLLTLFAGVGWASPTTPTSAPCRCRRPTSGRATS